MGTRFLSAFVPSPVCAPSRACLASGRAYDDAGVPSNFANDYPAFAQPTFYAKLRDDFGYWTMTTGKDDLTKASQLGTRNNASSSSDWRGLYHQAALGFSDGLRSSGKMDVVDTAKPHELYGHFLSTQRVVSSDNSSSSAWDAHVTCMKRPDACDRASMFPDDLYEDNWVTSNALELLRRRPRDGRPFFLQVSFPGPHPPFLVTANMTRAVGNGTRFPGATLDDGNGTAPEEICTVNGLPQERDRCSYAAELENLDRRFAEILDEVDFFDGGSENTLVCVSSDHGEMLGDHGNKGKSMPWQGSASVPLFCAGAGVARGRVVERPVGTIDLAATFLDFAGVGGDVRFASSASLRPLMMTSAASPTYNKTHVLSGLENWRMVVENGTGYKFVCCEGTCPGAPKNAPSVDAAGWQQILYDTVRDPYDERPILGDADAEMRLRGLLPEAFGCGR